MLNGNGAHSRDWMETLEPDGDVIFVLATGHAPTRATFTAELARRLGAVRLDAVVVLNALRAANVEGRRSIVASVLAGLVDAQLQARISVVVDADLDLEIEAELNRVRRRHPDVPVVRVQALEGQSLRPDTLVDEVIDRAHRRRG